MTSGPSQSKPPESRGNCLLRTQSQTCQQQVLTTKQTSLEFSQFPQIQSLANQISANIQQFQLKQLPNQVFSSDPISSSGFSSQLAVQRAEQSKKPCVRIIHNMSVVPLTANHFLVFSIHSTTTAIQLFLNLNSFKQFLIAIIKKKCIYIRYGRPGQVYLFNT